jgi:hypothetical protein
MTERTPDCQRCRVTMEEGYLLDRGHGNHQDPAKWVEGEPVQRRWLGLKIGVQTKDREVRQVQAYRCPRCGLLESYAR